MSSLIALFNGCVPFVCRVECFSGFSQVITDNTGKLKDNGSQPVPLTEGDFLILTHFTPAIENLVRVQKIRRVSQHQAILEELFLGNHSQPPGLESLYDAIRVSITRMHG